MNIRALHPADIDELREIHARYYSKEFEFPDFLNNFLCCFVVVDDKDSIISGGGVRLIAESVLLTDKSRSTRDRRTALLQILDASEYLAKRADFSRLHAVTENEDWKNHLSKIGFHSRGDLLVLDL